MKFAKYWRNITVPVNEKIFGRKDVLLWGASNESTESALNSAKARAAQFKDFFTHGFQGNNEYEYWNGFIKEEVIDEVTSEDGRVLAVLTRNSYGATVLNTEIVLFGDIDVAVSSLLSRLLEKLGKTKKDKSYFLSKIETYQKNNPELSIKVYETFAGLRFVITNEIFEADSVYVNKIFSALDVDPLYRRLCKRQTCFRARLTPKPWRVDVERPGSRFPRSNKQEQMDFGVWLKSYRLASTRKSVTTVLKVFGNNEIHPDVLRVLKIHDSYTCGISEELA